MGTQGFTRMCTPLAQPTAGPQKPSGEHAWATRARAAVKCGSADTRTMTVAQKGPLCLWGDRDSFLRWGFLTTQLPRPESQGPSKFKFPLHSFQPAHSVLPLGAPHSRLPLLSPGAWASCSQSCSNQTCLSHVQPAGTS